MGIIEKDKKLKELIENEARNGEEIIEENYIPEDHDPSVICKTETIVTNPVTGISTPIIGSDEFDLSEENQAKFEEILHDIEISSNSIDADELTNFMLSSNVYKNVTKEDVIKLIDIYNKLKTDSKYPAYNNFPKSIKTIVDKLLSLNAPKVPMALSNNIRSLRNSLSKSFVIELVDNAIYEKTTKNMSNKMQELINDEFKQISKESVSGFLTNQKLLFETKYIEEAKKKEDNGDIETANKIRKMSEWFTESYTLNDMYKTINDNYNKYAKISDIKIKKFNRECDTFNYKFEHSEYHIKDISAIPAILIRHLNKNNESKYTSEDVIKFMLDFFKYTINFKEYNLHETVFITQFIGTVYLLDTLVTEEDVLIGDSLINGVRRIIDLRRMKEEKNETH